jgi:hypothetical protein
MNWQKLGHVFVADNQFDWMCTHASWPRALNLEGDVYRVYFSPRDAANRSHIAFLDIDIRNPSNIISLSSSPVLSPGDAGLFDDCGVIPCCFTQYHKRIGLYYTGLSVTKNVPYISFCGLVYLNSKLDCATRSSKVPLLDRNEFDPFSGGAVFVCFDEIRNIFHMWYESCLGWSSKGFSLVPRFAIKYASSDDGLHWNRRDVISVPAPKDGDCISNPSVMMERGLFKMWYSYKTVGKYRIGYAESDDGMNWVRKDDEAGITVSESGWDSEEIEYPYVFDHKGERYMLYNGNGYGRTGFGLAKLINN